jgi:hypothetical protein
MAKDMEQWEYKVHVVPATSGFLSTAEVPVNKVEHNFNVFGAEGWELVSCVDTNNYKGETKEILCIFKRRK